MRLNGWQRIYCILVFSWVTYIALAIYVNLAELDNRINVAESILAGLETLDAEAAAKRKQVGDVQNTSIKRAKDEKVISITVAAFLMIIPPVLVYSIIAWIVAGFRAKEIKEQ